MHPFIFVCATPTPSPPHRPHSVAGGLNYPPPPHTPSPRGSQGSLTSTSGRTQSHFPQRVSPLHSASGLSSQWDAQSTASLSISVASLNIDGDLLEHFELVQHAPSELHIAALYGEL